MFHFIGEITAGRVKLAEDEILDSKWVSLQELMHLRNEEIRNPLVIRQIVKALQSSGFYSITIFKEKLNAFG